MSLQHTTDVWYPVRYEDGCKLNRRLDANGFWDEKKKKKKWPLTQTLMPNTVKQVVRQAMDLDGLDGHFAAAELPIWFVSLARFHAIL